MTFFESFRKWNGKFVNVDNAYGAQCMDWMHQFKLDVFGLDRTNLQSPSAKALWLNFPNVKGSKYFKKMINYPWAIPKQGDIMLWTVGEFGHVAIFNEGNLWRFSSIDQNWPLNSPVHIQEHNYFGKLAGWLRKI